MLVDDGRGVSRWGAPPDARSLGEQPVAAVAGLLYGRASCEEEGLRLEHRAWLGGPPCGPRRKVTSVWHAFQSLGSCSGLRQLVCCVR